MAKREKAVEKEKEFYENIEKWQKLEDTTIESAEEIIAKTDNIVVKTIMDVIKRDSEKHKMILQQIKDVLTKAYTLRPDEVGEIMGLLEKHRKIEKDAIQMAEDGLGNARVFAIRHLLTYILDDERKHHRMMVDLGDFRRELYPYG